MLELEGTSQTLVELYISQSVRPKLMLKLMLKLNLGTSMADMEFITLVPLWELLDMHL